MKVIHKESTYIIYKQKSGYLVHNTLLPFRLGHTHLGKYESCEDAIYYCINRKIPQRLNRYFLVSLIRLSKNEDYVEELQEALISIGGEYYVPKERNK